jgi:tetraacyldisaccharide 4'-kinase
MDRCDVPIYFLRVDIEMVSGAEDFHACIERICFKNAPAGRVQA